MGYTRINLHVRAVLPEMVEDIADLLGEFEL